jgi:hypothetical protein
MQSKEVWFHKAPNLEELNFLKEEVNKFWEKNFCFILMTY